MYNLESACVKSRLPRSGAPIALLDGFLHDNALWADRTTHSSVTGYMPTELMFGQKPLMPMEQTVSSWATVD